MNPQQHCLPLHLHKSLSWQIYAADDKGATFSDVFFAVTLRVKYHTLCLRAVNALASLHKCFP